MNGILFQICYFCNWTQLRERGNRNLVYTSSWFLQRQKHYWCLVEVIDSGSKEPSDIEKVDTRHLGVTKSTKSVKKLSSMSKTIEEAKVILGKDSSLMNIDSGRTLRPSTRQATKMSVSKRKPTASRVLSKKTKKVAGGQPSDSVSHTT
ncbi:unnamed protein product [Heterobilharzia americana]|nr:unnamed protein product [Heterobilharzia americana]